MYEIIRIEADKNGKPQYAVVNSVGDTLCEFYFLSYAAAFVHFLQGGEISESDRFSIDEAVHRFYKKCKSATKQGG
jgi:hypothetical protein